MFRVFQVLLLATLLTACPSKLPFELIDAVFISSSSETDLTTLPTQCALFSAELLEGQTVRHTGSRNISGSLAAVGILVGNFDPRPDVALELSYITSVRVICTAQDGSKRSASKPFPQQSLRVTNAPAFKYTELNP